MSWLFLIISGIFEMIGVLVFKQVAIAKGKKLFFWLLVLMGVFSFSLTFLSLAMRNIDMSIAYGVWTGIGASGGVVLASIVYKEKITLAKGICLLLIIGSMIGLKLIS